MDNEIARDSWSAWNNLCDQGGIEVDRRDRDLVIELREDLAPEAPSLESAIRSVSTDRLVTAIFRRVAPFAQMFVDIVDFFKAAGARSGKAHWRVKIEGENIELKDFESFLECWSSTETLIDVPAVDLNAIWQPYSWMRDGFPGGEATSSGDPVVDAWLRAYANGLYLPFPESLTPSRVPSGLADLAAVALVACERIRETFGSRNRMTPEVRSTAPRDDAFAPGSLALHEHDNWLGSMVTLLNWWRRRPEDERQDLEQHLAELYGTYGRRQFPLKVSLSELERILSLPVWRTRHELYAVWVATQIVAALPDHNIELHHENGSIVFAFKATVIATIQDVTPKLRLIGERRQDLDNPIGKGRVGGVQPDFGLWAGDADNERCVLVVEVKHYLKAARRTFHEAVVDYANAHPKAEIALVNYGPVADMLQGVDASLLGRCRQLGHLTPANLVNLETFKKLVKDAVDRVVQAHTAGSHEAESLALVIDVSASMKPLLNEPAFEAYLKLRANDFGLIVLADHQIQAQCDFSDAITAARAFDGGGTELLGVVRKVIVGRQRVIVVTDRDGSLQLQDLGADYIVNPHRLSEQDLTAVVIDRVPNKMESAGTPADNQIDVKD